MEGLYSGVHGLDAVSQARVLDEGGEVVDGRGEHFFVGEIENEVGELDSEGGVTLLVLKEGAEVGSFDVFFVVLLEGVPEGRSLHFGLFIKIFCNFIYLSLERFRFVHGEIRSQPTSEISSNRGISVSLPRV